MLTPEPGSPAYTRPWIKKPPTRVPRLKNTNPRIQGTNGNPGDQTVTLHRTLWIEKVHPRIPGTNDNSRAQTVTLHPTFGIAELQPSYSLHKMLTPPSTDPTLHPTPRLNNSNPCIPGTNANPGAQTVTLHPTPELKNANPHIPGTTAKTRAWTPTLHQTPGLKKLPPESLD